MVKLKSSDSEGGFINITDTYFDFHRTLYKPELTNLDVRGKVLDDKLMETKYAKKLHISKLKAAMEGDKQLLSTKKTVFKGLYK